MLKDLLNVTLLASALCLLLFPTSVYKAQPDPAFILESVRPISLNFDPVCGIYGNSYAMFEVVLRASEDTEGNFTLRTQVFGKNIEWIIGDKTLKGREVMLGYVAPGGRYKIVISGVIKRPLVPKPDGRIVIHQLADVPLFEISQNGESVPVTGEKEILRQFKVNITSEEFCNALKSIEKANSLLNQVEALLERDPYLASTYRGLLDSLQTSLKRSRDFLWEEGEVYSTNLTAKLLAELTNNMSKLIDASLALREIARAEATISTVESMIWKAREQGVDIGLSLTKLNMSKADLEDAKDKLELGRYREAQVLARKASDSAQAIEIPSPLRLPIWTLPVFILIGAVIGVGLICLIRYWKGMYPVLPWRER